MHQLPPLNLWLPHRPGHKLSLEHVAECGKECWEWLAAAHMAACLAAHIDGVDDLIEKARTSDSHVSQAHVEKVREVVSGGIAGTKWPPQNAVLAATLASHMYLAGLALR